MAVPRFLQGKLCDFDDIQTAQAFDGRELPNPAGPVVQSGFRNQRNRFGPAEEPNVRGQILKKQANGKLERDSVKKFASHHLAIHIWFQAQKVRSPGQGGDCSTLSASYSLPMLVVKEGKCDEEIRLRGTNTYRASHYHITSVHFSNFDHLPINSAVK